MAKVSLFYAATPKLEGGTIKLEILKVAILYLLLFTFLFGYIEFRLGYRKWCKDMSQPAWWLFYLLTSLIPATLFVIMFIYG